jgi:hypothetical protein
MECHAVLGDNGNVALVRQARVFRRVWMALVPNVDNTLVSVAVSASWVDLLCSGPAAVVQLVWAEATP